LGSVLCAAAATVVSTPQSYSFSAVTATHPPHGMGPKAAFLAAVDDWDDELW
jgi:hypothetical protein